MHPDPVGDSAPRQPWAIRLWAALARASLAGRFQADLVPSQNVAPARAGCGGQIPARALRLADRMVTAEVLSEGDPLRWLRDRVSDAWIAGDLPDLPANDVPEFVVIELCPMPCQLQAARHHPLASKSGLTPEHGPRFPSLALPEGWFPKLESRRKSQHLWSTPSLQLRPYDMRSGGVGAPPVRPPSASMRAIWSCNLSWRSSTGTSASSNLSHLAGEALVVGRELAEQDRIEKLLEA